MNQNVEPKVLANYDTIVLADDPMLSVNYVRNLPVKRTNVYTKYTNSFKYQIIA